MNNEDIFNGITDIRDDIVERAEKHRFRKKRKYPLYITAVAAMLVVVMLIGISNPIGTNAYAISIAEYPEMPQYPNEEDYYKSNGDWDYESYSEDMDSWRSAKESLTSGIEETGQLTHFLNETIPEFLADSNGENKVYSPLNVYLALSMLTELTDGNSREQILDLLGSEDIESLRSEANSLWRSNYNNDGQSTSILASSLWLNEDISFNQSTMDTIAENYYSSSYRGEMGSSDFNEAFHDWLNEQTGGLLEEQIESINFTPDTVLALATTIYFKAAWRDKFYEGLVKPDTFYTENGEITCDYMHKSDIRSYYKGESFTSVSESLTGNNNMWFILPDENISVDELLMETELVDFIQKGFEWENKTQYSVNLSVPKFDITSQIDLAEGLMNLGITDIFDSIVSDFSPMTEDAENLYVTQAQHDARVMIDEEGCTAAAYTVIVTEESCAEESAREIDFTLDRPFIFVITGPEGLPLFIGIVNQPV
ncbi:MAG: serpin family protein [Ruminococcaceae bacterium]|nr:serpin family protein [Oscillospiraceae bacterium]